MRLVAIDAWSVLSVVSVLWRSRASSVSWLAGSTVSTLTSVTVSLAILAVIGRLLGLASGTPGAAAPRGRCMQDVSGRKNGSLDLEKSLKGKDGSSYKDSNALKSMKLIVISRRGLAWSSDWVWSAPGQGRPSRLSS